MNFPIRGDLTGIWLSWHTRQLEERRILPPMRHYRGRRYWGLFGRA
jgi:hypothetical protein